MGSGGVLIVSGPSLGELIGFSITWSSTTSVMGGGGVGVGVGEGAAGVGGAEVWEGERTGAGG